MCDYLATFSTVLFTKRKPVCVNGNCIVCYIWLQMLHAEEDNAHHNGLLHANKLTAFVLLRKQYSTIGYYHYRNLFPLYVIIG